MNRFLPSRRMVLEAIVLVTVAIMAGLTLNYSMVMSAFSGRSVPGASAAKPAVTSERLPVPVDFAELDELLEKGAILVDARDAELYRDSHLAGALSLPLGEATVALEDFATRVSTDRTLITYCNGFGCPDSFDLGVLLLKAGYQDVLVYEGGYPEWRDEGRPLESGGGE